MNFDKFKPYTNIEKDRCMIGGRNNTRLMRKIDNGAILVKALCNSVTIDGSCRIYNAQEMSFGENCYIGPYVYLRGKIDIGAMSWIGPFAQINGEGGCKIGRGVGIGNMVQILTSEHIRSRINEPISFQPLSFDSVMIADGANIGIGSILLPGVRIGERAQVGAGSVVTKHTIVGDDEVWAGNPAKQLKHPSKRIKRWKHLLTTLPLK